VTKHIGIVACSAEGAALCYRTLCMEAPALMGRHAHPEVSLHTYCLSDYMEAIYKGDWARVGQLMQSSAQKLISIGADFLICPDNTIHQALPMIRASSPKPWLHIAEVVATSACLQKQKTIGVLGTRYLMEGPVYPMKLGDKNLAFEIPEACDRERINSIIFDELVNGIITKESRATFIEIIEKLKDRACDAVVLGCTEIPLIINDEISPLPTLDSTRLLARAALTRAMG
jgi:aspartate racemase